MSDSDKITSPSVFEIKEFIDDEGEILSSELADLGKQLSETGLNWSNLKEMKGMENPKNHPDIQRRLLDDLDRIGAFEAKPSPPDEHSLFVRELAELRKQTENDYQDAEGSSETTHPNTIVNSAIKSQSQTSDILKSLLEQEESLKSNKTKENNRISGKGWKKGFFHNSVDKPPNPPTKVNDQTSNPPVLFDRISDKASTLNNSLDEKNPIETQQIKSKAVRFAEPSRIEESSSGVTEKREKTEAKMQSRPVAFSGAIVERFP